MPDSKNAKPLKVSASLSKMLAEEHVRGFHSSWHHPDCEACLASGAVVAEPTRSPAPLPEPPDEPPAKPPDKPRGNLAEILARIRGRITVDPTEDQDEQPLRSPLDGGEWCDTCRGMRVVRRDVPRDDPDFGKALTCPVCTLGVLRQRRLERLLGQLPERLREPTLESFGTSLPAQARLIRLARLWLEDPGHPWLYIWGPIGRGKSHVAVGMLRAWIEAGHSGHFQPVRGLLDALRAGYEDGSYRDLMRALVEAELLVLDDLGSERHKDGSWTSGEDDWATEKIFQIISGRYDQNLRTIITTNYSLDQLTERLGSPRVSSRVFEMATTRYIVDVSILPDRRQERGDARLTTKPDDGLH